MRNKFFVVCNKDNGAKWYFQNMEKAIRLFYELSKANNVKEINGKSADEIVNRYKDYDFSKYYFSITNDKASVFIEYFED